MCTGDFFDDDGDNHINGENYRIVIWIMMKVLEEVTVMVEMMEVVEKTAVYRSDLPEMQKKRQKKNNTKRRSEVMQSFYWSFKIITDLRLSFSCHPKYCIGF